MRMLRLTSDSFDRRLLQVVCFGGAPVVIACGGILVGQVAADAGQLVVGVLAAGALAVSLVTLGLVRSRLPAGEERRGVAGRSGVA